MSRLAGFWVEVDQGDSEGRFLSREHSSMMFLKAIRLLSGVF